ncbi:MAG TPA: alpha/beta fold hydrolase [Dokdonella sp.]
MDIQLDSVDIPVERVMLEGTLLSPATSLPAVLFVHGWGGSQRHDLVRAREAAAIGCECLTFDLRGHERTAVERENVSRAQNLDDVVAAYDWLAARRNVDRNAIAVVGISYGGYLAALLTTLRPVRWLALRTPALYKDEGWELPKRQLHDADLPAWRRRIHAPDESRALRACEAFAGDALVVQAGRDSIVPPAVIRSYVNAFRDARSLTTRVIADADHAFSAKDAQHEYTTILVEWLTGLIVRARGGAAREKLRRHGEPAADDAEAAGENEAHVERGTAHGLRRRAAPSR